MEVSAPAFMESTLPSRSTYCSVSSETPPLVVPALGRFAQTIACMSRKFAGLAFWPSTCETRAAIGTADTPAEPISGFTLPPVSLYITLPNSRPPTVENVNAIRPRMMISEFESKEHEILNGVVARIDPRSGTAYLDVVSGGEKSEAVLAASEQVRGEVLTEGQRLKVYLIEVRRGTRGPQVVVSRTHPGLVKRLFELEVPEIHSGIVEVKSIAREAGNRTKIAVVSHDENVDPIGACVGTRGARVANITGELNGEKIDIIKWNEDMAQFVSAALAPADVINATMQADNKSCRVIVPDDQLSLAIGKEGQNARLAAKLTGCKIDIAPESQGE